MVSIPEKMITAGGLSIPLIGMGMATAGVGTEAVKSGVIEAIKAGYRHFDTAALYGTEKPLGEAINEALRSGLVVSRAELFITTKLWCDSTEPRLVLPAINQSLRNLGLDYVDLYLIHLPIKIKQGDLKSPILNEHVTEIDIKGVWEAMEECQNLGLTKSIGVSNFSTQKIQQIISFAKIPPVVNQVEVNPLWQQKKLNEFCKENNILITAYSPLGAVGTSWGHNRVMENKILKDIAKSKGKTIAQISLRWLYEQGVRMVVKSFNTQRMKENIDIFDWSLTKEELDKISQIPQCKHNYLNRVMVTEHCDILAEIDAEL